MSEFDQHAPIGNDERGEDEITLGRKTYVLRPSYEAIKALEKETGKTVLELVALGNAGRISIEDLGVIVAELIRAGAKPGDVAARVSGEGIGIKILEKGLISTIPLITLLLIDVASGGRTASGERKAAAETSGSLTAA